MSAPRAETVQAAPEWTRAILREIEHLGSTLIALRFEVTGRIDHLPGQHYVIRLRAPDGYTAQRSYSVASDPADPLLELMVERLPRGEVSSFLHEVAEVGDEFELRGPIGGWFVWDGATPSICVGGGSGVAPIISMMRHARRTDTGPLLNIVASARTRDTLPYADELEDFGALIALTRENHRDRVAAHIYPEEIAEVAQEAERAYVCGSTGFVSFAGRLLGEAGVRRDFVRIEQFGPST